MTEKFKDVKNYLKQIRYLRNSIAQKKAELEELRATAADIKATAYNNTAVKKSRRDTDALYVNRLMRIDALERRIEEEIVCSSEKKHEILSMILCMQNGIYSQILTMHYVELKSFEDISEETGYSYQYVINLHRKAIAALGEIYIREMIDIEKSA